MIYLLLGTDNSAKDQKLSDLKSQFISSSSAQSFDFESLDAHKLNAEDFKKALVSLPAFGKRRLVVIQTADKLTKQNQELLLAFLESKPSHVDIILEASTGSTTRGFWGKVAAKAKVFEYQQGKKQNVFDMARVMERDQAGALKILSQMLNDGQHPLQILGGLVWYWGNKAKERVSAQVFKKGLLELQEADVNIKRSRLTPEQAIELCVVKLSLLISY